MTVRRECIQYYINSYARLGWKCIPLNGKKPFWKRWDDPEMWETQYSNDVTLQTLEQNDSLNVGILTGELSGIIAIDIDNPKLAGFREDKLKELIKQGALAHTTSKAPRIIFRSSNPEVLNFSKKVVKKRSEVPEELINESDQDKEVITIVEILGSGRQFVAPPSVHPRTGQRLEWISPLPENPEEIYEIKDLNHLRSVLFDLFDHEIVLEIFGDLGRAERERKDVGEDVLKEWLNVILKHLDVAKEGGNYILCHCPFHPPDNTPSFAIYRNSFLAVDFHDGAVYTLKQLAKELEIELPKAKTKREITKESINRIEITKETINQIVEAVKPYWKPGNRHNLALGLGGLFYHSGIDLEKALEIITRICQETNDENMRERLRAVEDCYIGKNTAYKPFFKSFEGLLTELQRILQVNELWCWIKTEHRKRGTYKEYYRVNSRGVFLEGLINEDGKWKLVKRELVISKPLRFTRELEGAEPRFEVVVGDKTIVGTLRELKEELTNMGVVAKNRTLEDCLSRIIETSRESGSLEKAKVYEMAGVFEEDGKLKIVHPALGTEIIPYNALASEIVSTMKKFEVDEDGETAKIFAKLIAGLKPEFRFIIAGYSAIAPFFWVLKESYGLNVTPHLLLYDRRGTGKSQTLSIFTRNLYGTKTFIGDDLRSDFRLMSLISATTFPLLVDEVGATVSSSALEILKASSTGVTEGHRGLKNQKMKGYLLTSPFCMTANKWGWGDSALREGRLIAIPTCEKISDLTEEEFTQIKIELEKSKKLFGLYLLKSAIDLIPTGADLLKTILNEELRVKRELEGIEVVDSRRYKIYALLRVGYKLWINALLKALSEDEFERLKQKLQEPLKTERFREIVKEIEDAIKEDKQAQLDGLKAWVIWLQKEESTDGIDGWGINHILWLHKTRNGEELALVTVDALSSYNEFARSHGFQTYLSLKELGKVVADLLNLSVREVYKPYKIGGKWVKAVGIPKTIIFE